MALVLIPNPPTALTLSSHWTDFVSREDKSNVGTGIGMSIFRLTNWDVGTAKPLVAQGSIIEVGGSIYQADSDTALTDDTGLVDGLCFIKLVPGAGSPDPTTVTPTLTSDAMPSWDAEKGGWYDSDDKFLPLLMTRSGSGSSFINKGEYVDQNKRVIQYIDGGTYFAGGAEIGGSLSVGSGATFGGNLSGVGSISMGGSISGATTITASGDLSCDDIDSLDIRARGIRASGEIDPTDAPTRLDVPVTAGGTYTIPRGLYIAVCLPTNVEPEYFVQGFGWVPFAPFTSSTSVAVILSDGTNARLFNNGGSTLNGILFKF